MKRIKYVIALLLCISITCTGCIGFKLVKNDNYTNYNGNFDEYCDNLIKEVLKDDSFTAHFLVTDEADYGIKYSESDYNLGEISLEYSKENTKKCKKELSELKTFKRSNLDDSQKMTYDVLCAYLEKQTAFEGTEELENILAPNSGIISNISTNFVEFKFYDKEDVDHYLLYLKDSERYMNDAFKFVRQQSKDGYFMSDAVADEVIDFCQSYIEANEDPLIDSFNEKIDSLPLSDKEKEQYKSINSDYVNTYFNPIFKETIDLLKELKGTGKNDGGLCNYGNEGKKYYNAILADKTSSEMSANEIIEMLDDTMNDILIEATAISTADYNAYLSALYYQPDFDDPNEVLKYILGKMKSDFPEPVTTNYTIQYQSEACQIDGVIAYYIKTRIDDTNDNSIKVNGSEVGDDSLMLYTTLAHEGYPGHLFEFTNFLSNKNVPEIRKIVDFIGSTEGWAEYASDYTLKYLELSDNERKVIEINSLYSYVMCSRIDLGVNYENWSVSDTADYLRGLNITDESVAESIYTSIIGDPGIYLPYTIGHIKMNKLREKAEKQLGDNFDDKEYHTWLLEDVGIATFEIYDSELDKWLADK